MGTRQYCYLLILTAVLCSSCSSEEGKSQREKSEELGREAAAAIKKPIDAARRAAESVEQHNQELEEAVK
jgi:hypothetical protein